LLVCQALYKQEQAIVIVRIKQKKREAPIIGQLAPEVITKVVLVLFPDC
jgi:hypothetical protein